MGTALFARAAEKRGRYLALVYFLSFAVLTVVVGVLAAHEAKLALHFLYAKQQPDSGTAGLIAEPATAAAVLLTTFVMALISKQPFLSFGLGGRHRLRNFAIGLAAGIGLIAALLLAMQALGGFSFGALAGTWPTLVKNGALYGLLFLAVAITEEFLFRGYGLVMLSRFASFWPAAILLALLFGAAHLGNGGEDAVGALAAGSYALGAALSFRWTGSLWYALGVHTGIGYAESFLFGVPNSGNLLSGRALLSSVHGPAWLTGGTVGPEGSLLVVGPLILIMFTAWLLRERQT